MAQETKAGMDQQRADENERLRRLAADELAAMRIELARALDERVELHKDLNLLAERLSDQENRTALALEDKQRTEAELQAELANSADTVQRQAAHIARLKKQMERPTRLLAKKVLRRAPKQSGSGNAS